MYSIAIDEDGFYRIQMGGERWAEKFETESAARFFADANC